MPVCILKPQLATQDQTRSHLLSLSNLTPKLEHVCVTLLHPSCVFKPKFCCYEAGAKCLMATCPGACYSRLLTPALRRCVTQFETQSMAAQTGSHSTLSVSIHNMYGPHNISSAHTHAYQSFRTFNETSQYFNGLLLTVMVIVEAFCCQTLITPRHFSPLGATFQV